MSEDFWAEVEEEHLPSPLNEELLNSIEIELEKEYPKSFIDFLRIQNGGYTNKNSFTSPSGRVIDYIDRISGIGGHPTLDTADDSEYYIEEWELPENLILIAGDGHWWIALDYRKLNSNSEPTICYIESDSEIDETIAESFDKFINGLKLKRTITLSKMH